MSFEFNRASVPEELAALPQWLMWRFESLKGKAKLAKVPYWCHDEKRKGQQGGPADRAALLTLDAALAQAQKRGANGVGFAFLPDDGLIGVDLDKVINADTGEIKPGAQKIIDTLASYTEISPSGTGVHIIVRGPKIKSEKDNGVGVEVFCGSQFFTWSARPYPGTPPQVREVDQALLDRLLAVVRGAKEKRRADPPARPAARSQDGASMPVDVRAKVESALAMVSPDMNYDDWIGIGGAIYAELGPQAFEVWDAWSSRGSTYPGSAKLQSHWKSFKSFSGGGGAIFKRAMEAGWRPPKPPRAAKPAAAPPAKPASKPISTPSKAPAEVAGGGEPPDGLPPGPPNDPPPDDASDWRDYLIRKRGELKECRENVLIILRDHPEWRECLGVDVFAKKIVIRRDSPIGQKPGAEWSANDDIELGLWLAQQEGLQVSSLDAISAGVSYVAKLQPFHPVREYFDGLKWDQVPRVDSWGVRLMGCADDEYDRLVGRLFLLNLVRRIYEPGCVMRSVPVLEGAQNKGKSTALRLLSQPWYSDTMFKVGDKDAFQLIQGVMLYEISELESFSKSEATAVKAFISSVQDKFRAPYARMPETHLRETMFAATTNAREYLKDWTGNTRFWPWRLMVDGEIRLDEIARERDQLLAEVIHIYKAGRLASQMLAGVLIGDDDGSTRARCEATIAAARSYPTQEQEINLFAPQQDERLVPHPWQEKLRGFLHLSSIEKFSVMDLLKDGIGFDIARASPQGMEAQTVGRVMASLPGWEKKRTAEGWVWVRPKASAATIAAPGSAADTTELKEDRDVPF